MSKITSSRGRAFLEQWLEIESLETPTITDETKLRQVGGKIGNTGKNSLNGPQSQVSRNYKGASWQIPPGVPKGNWDYVRAGQIANAYDDFLRDDPLTEADWQILNRYLPGVDPKVESNTNSGQPVVADFGCGTGRSLEPLLDRGYSGLAIDLSIPMLRKFGEKVQNNTESSRSLIRVQANLVELDGISSESVDHAICMFSTLGMIQGADFRSQFLAHANRMIKPGGYFIVHAHNAVYQLTHRHGFRWGVKSALSHLMGKSEFGDRTATYRGVKDMFIHSFRKRELGQVLKHAGFDELQWFGISPGKSQLVDKVSWSSFCRLAGWIVVGRKPSG